MCCVVEGGTHPATLVKDAGFFSVKTVYADLHDNIVEMLSCTALFAMEIIVNRN